MACGSRRLHFRRGQGVRGGLRRCVWVCAEHRISGTAGASGRPSAALWTVAIATAAGAVAAGGRASFAVRGRERRRACCRGPSKDLRGLSPKSRRGGRDSRSPSRWKAGLPAKPSRLRAKVPGLREGLARAIGGVASGCIAVGARGELAALFELAGFYRNRGVGDGIRRSPRSGGRVGGRS